MRKKSKPKNSEGPVFAVTFDPRLPSLGSIQAKHWRSMKARDSYLGKVFKRPPIIAYKRQQNLRGYLVRAQVPKEQDRYPKRHLNGMNRCNKNCTACPNVSQGKNIKINGISWKINKNLDCQSSNVIYAICCKKEKCNQVYIGETKRILKFRLNDHWGYVNHIDNATGSHFNQAGHSLADLSVTVIEKVKKLDYAYRKEREEYFIRKFNTLHRGLNRKY